MEYTHGLRVRDKDQKDIGVGEEVEKVLSTTIVREKDVPKGGKG